MTDSRLVAFHTLRDVTADGAYTNLALAGRLRQADLDARDAAFVTELVAGTARAIGTLDAIIVAAAGRELKTLQPAVVDVLRLGAYQLLCMRVPPHAAVHSTVGLATEQIGRRVSGLVNAVLRRVAGKSWDDWLDELTAGLDAADTLALRHQHPRWIVDALAGLLPPDELEPALAADNVAPRPTLAVRPGLIGADRLPGTPTRFSPWGVVIDGDPGEVPAVREGLAGVQDEGSQLVVLAAGRAAGAGGPESTSPWLDMCAGPGGKTALLRGLAGGFLVAADAQAHRAGLVAGNLRAYDPGGHIVVVADGTRPAWSDGTFGLVSADVPCTGLGALRRRPEARWRRTPADAATLVPLQQALLRSALAAARPDGVVAYITCSPLAQETAAVVASAHCQILDAPSFLPEVPGCAAATDPRFVQLWPHRHGTDAMFLALLSRTRR